MVLRGEVVGRDTHRVTAVFGERMHHRSEHVVHGFGLLFLDKHHGQLHDVAHKDGRCDAASLDGDNLIDVCIGKMLAKFLRYFHHQVGVHLVIDKAVYL